MIVRFSSTGSSFKGLAAYLTHDANKAETSERVAWTHTLNCANDEVNGAVNEMYWTAEDAELLKQEAGIRAGGRSTENPVKHVSLNWSPRDNPTREHMIETSNSFLAHMGWDEHQAVIVAHEDKTYKHCHLMLNAVHPETGLKLNDSFEQRRAQEWALQYELSQENIRCEQRLKNMNERENAPTRPAWMAFKNNEKQFENAEKILSENQAGNSENTENNYWRQLKQMQRDEREQFFAGGKSAFSEIRSSVYGEVREHFRGQWSEYYAAKRDGADDETLGRLKAGLVADQKAMLDSRRDEACQGLRDYRDGFYHDLLNNQQAARHELHACLAEGRDTSHLFEASRDSESVHAMHASFREEAAHLTERQGGHERGAESEYTAREDDSMDAVADTGASIGFGLGWNALSLAHSVFLEFEGSKNITRPRADPAETKAFEQAAEESCRHQERQRLSKDEEERERRQRERCIGD